MLLQFRLKYRYSTILLRELVISGFKLRYQDSVLGYVWSLLKPIFVFTILYVVLVEFLGIGAGDPTWPVALFLGIVLWNFFAEVTGMGLTSIIDRGDMIRKINFPKYVIVLSTSFLALINLLLNFAVVIIFMSIKGIYPDLSAFLAILCILGLFIFALGLAFFLASIFVRLRDINYIWEIVMQAMFYGSVVMFPLSTVIEKNSTLAKILLLNPIAFLIQETRNLLISETNPTLISLTNQPLFALIPISIIILVFIFGAWYFRRQSPYFAENI